eukprot:CAMPEP_0174251302 /NCGR_PEP_ID=MMETSP0439-20130205/1162_1 /TAXON_ID=0 /ORGANISM="Stereomyxa ramosa, Strain Chinc5" /LENGTH=274 /DNA_ID=CAMNT_0015331575 /DNA_START=88 /DNA_END=909 /DNA_ORIENTATION=+
MPGRLNDLLLGVFVCLLSANLCVCSSDCSVLTLMPSEAFLRIDGGAMVQVGSFLDETMIPMMTFLDHGCQVTFATPTGTKPPLDPRSNDTKYFDSEEEYEDALKLWNSLSKFQRPSALSEFASDDLADMTRNPSDSVYPNTEVYNVIFIPGGHSPMIDLWPSASVSRILNWAQKNKKLIISICHGPVTLASASLLQQPWVFSGYNMTVFSTEEEQTNEVRWGAKMGFYPPDVLANLGGVLSEVDPWQPNVVVDRNLITAQNPYSATLLTKVMTP